MVSVTLSRPGGKGAANSEGGAQRGIKNSHHFSPEGNEEMVKASDRGGGRRMMMARLSFRSISGCGLFYWAELTAAQSLTFSCAPTCSPAQPTSMTPLFP